MRGLTTWSFRPVRVDIRLGPCLTYAASDRIDPGAFEAQRGGMVTVNAMYAADGTTASRRRGCSAAALCCSSRGARCLCQG